MNQKDDTKDENIGKNKKKIGSKITSQGVTKK